LRLSNYSDYALRLLIYAATKSDGLVTIAEISKAYGISKNHLMKIAHELARAGYIKTVRGRNGGLCLARPAEEIRVGDVVRLTETGSVLVECCDPPTNRCIITKACRLKHVLLGALEKFYQHLDQTTLADLTSNGPDLLLSFAAASLRGSSVREANNSR
jgi:Rrf2 family transcriptional regulator, nitric oxide-sensitive transcriptional repressor